MAAPGPVRRALHRRLGDVPRRGSLDALVENHGDVRTERELDFRRFFGSEQMFGAVEVRTEAHAFIGDLPQFREAEHLVSAGIGENRAVPRHELVQSAQLANQCVPRPQI